MTTPIDPAGRLGDLVVQSPARAQVLERLRLDYCCGGQQTLAEACAQRGLDVDTVVTVLAAFDEDAPAPAAGGAHDVARASIAELCDHIVVAHHEPLRRELPRLAELAATVARVHGGAHPELGDVARIFGGMRAELEEHLGTEEAALFPACRAVDERPGARVDEALLAEHEHEHAEAGDALAALRELCGGYRTEHALCGTHRRLLEGLAAFELDLHQHVHEENNVLFPRVRSRVAAGA